MLNNKEGRIEEQKNRRKVFGTLLLVIIVVGAGLRFLQLGHESLWLDETASAIRVQMSWPRMFRALIQLKAHPPLHYILLKAWTDVFGYSEFSLRFISAVFSVLSIILFHRIAKMLFSEKVALLAAAILMMSRYHIDFAQEARCYALMGFLVLLSMYFFIRLWKTPTWGSYTGYVLASAAMLYNHYYAPFIIIAQNMFILTMYFYRKPILWKHIMYWFVGQALIGLCFTPWISVLRKAIYKIESVPTVLKTPGLANVLSCLKAFAGGQRWAAIIFLALVCLSFYGILKSALRRSGKNKIEIFYLIAVWLVVPVALPFLYSVYRAPIFSDRYTLISSYPYYLLMAVAVFSIQSKSVRYFLVGVILLTSLCTLLPRYFSHDNEAWREAASYIESKAQPGQALLFHAGFCGNTAYGFYAKRTDLSILGFPNNPESGYAVTESNIDQIDSLIDGYSHTWLILSHSRDKQGLIPEKMRHLGSQQEHVSFKGIEVYLFEMDPAPGLSIPVN